MVLSHIDYSNSLLSGCSVSNITKLHNALKTLLPRLFWTCNNCALPSSCSSTCTCLFPYEVRNSYFTQKVATLNQPLYLTHLLAQYIPGCSLRSQDKQLFLEPAVMTIIGSRGFSYAALSIRNKLPLEIRSSSSFACFKRNLKTTIFPIPSLKPALPSFALVTAYASDLARRLTTHNYKWYYCTVTMKLIQKCTSSTDWIMTLSSVSDEIHCQWRSIEQPVGLYWYTGSYTYMHINTYTSTGSATALFINITQQVHFFMT